MGYELGGGSFGFVCIALALRREREVEFTTSTYM